MWNSSTHAKYAFIFFNIGSSDFSSNRSFQNVICFLFCAIETLWARMYLKYQGSPHINILLYQIKNSLSLKINLYTLLPLMNIFNYLVEHISLPYHFIYLLIHHPI